ncbi:MBL fold metallo-hydrolase [Paenibacillus sp. FJAT-27812]|uniref:MBL fold metallo-hydrolase n=1 Tax=Paenibacillus sp. FJAT-27812 TaxID=1684143 RepID=UPI0006A78EDC|nr:MBL fold metallo-hydrolase [Paenibacillus sp. FJAT-27812]
MTANHSELTGMTAAALAKIVFGKDPLFILDVRNEEEYSNWRIEGEHVQTINIPYFEFLEGAEYVWDQIPEHQAVLVVCAKEGSSKYVAEQLMEHGIMDVSYLMGGMKAWSEHLEPVKVGDLNDGGAIYQFVRVGKGCLSYMIISGGEAAVVDAVRMTDVFTDFADNLGVKITHTIDTHLHADHISGGRKLAETTGGSYWLPPKDAGEVVFSYRKLGESSAITVGKSTISIQPVYAPGHTIGSTSLIVDGKYLLSGDSLFVQSIGRPDLAGKAEDWVDDLRNTLYKRYKLISEDLVVLPAHFGQVAELGEGGKVSARLGDLYRMNPGLNMQDEAEFRAAVTENLPPQPHAYEAIRQINMGKMSPPDEEQREMELGPNRCAIHDK